MAAAAPTQGGNNIGPPSSPPLIVNGRYRTGDDIDPLKDERSGLLREVGCQAIWSLSSCKPGFGVDQLRDQSLENYWQSDGQLPHLVNIQFRRKMTIRDICIYTDFKLDESYTPSKISIRCGTHFNDLQEVELVEFSEPSGWVQIFLKDIRDRPIRTFMLQLAVLSNHQNGRDTHLRQIRIHSPVDNLPVAVFPDVSIWLHQLVKGFRDKDGNPLPNAHLLGVFHRVCKLLNYGIKPVFVFDGSVPALKRQTIAARKNRKLESLDKAELSRQRILSAYLQQQLQRQAKRALPPSLRMQAQLGRLASGTNKSPSPIKRMLEEDSAAGTSKNVKPYDDKVDEDLEAFRAALVAKLEDDVDEVDPKLKKQESEEDDEDQTNSYHYGVDCYENFSVIQAPSFDTLPLETQHEILFEMQESRKMNSWGKFDKMPKDLQSFSSFQMDRLVKRRTLQKKIQTVQQEMGQRHIHVQNLDELLKMDYSAFENNETQVVDLKGDGFVLIKSQEPKKKQEPKPGTSSGTHAKPEVITIDDFIEDSDEDEVNIPTKNIPLNEQTKKTNKALDEEDEDLKLAIQLSLMESHGDNNGKLKEATPECKNDDVAIPSSRESDKGKLGQGDKVGSDDSHPLENIQSSQLSHCAKFLDTVGFHIPSALGTSSSGVDTVKDKVISLEAGEKSSQKMSSKVVDTTENTSDSEEDDDFEEVEEVEEPAHKTNPMVNPIGDKVGKSETGIIIDLTSISKRSALDEDIFADVFSAAETAEEGETLRESIPLVINGITTSEMMEKLPFEVEEDGSVPTQSCMGAESASGTQVDAEWDSDSEMEADLMQMVMAESVSTASKENSDREEIKLQSNSLSPSTKIDSVEDSERHENLGETAEEKVGESATNPPIRMITAEYMQAQDQLNSRLEKLHSERGFQERVATSISDQMQIETQELISLFGIPYIISPTEAESQCAFLDKACLTEGSITEDSDVWLFGGQRVFKNFFSQGQKHIEFYQAADIQRVLNLNREKLIVLAMMTGCDYSEGIQGVGPVLALEILSEFSSSGVDSFESLVGFREWWEDIQTKQPDVFSGSKLKEKLRKLKLRPGFPNRAVYEAFTNPSIDTSTEPFSWGNPDLDAIRTYTKQKFGWEQSKCDSLLLPVLKNFRCEVEQSRQLTLDSYLSFGKMPSLENGKRKRGSKRIESAVKKLKRVDVASHELNLSSESEDSQEEGETRKSRAAKKNNSRPVAGKSGGEAHGTGRKKVKALEDQVVVPSPSPRAVATPKILKKSEVIPQRVQSESDKMKSKQKAIEIFKKRNEKP